MKKYVLEAGSGLYISRASYIKVDKYYQMKVIVLSVRLGFQLSGAGA